MPRKGALYVAALAAWTTACPSSETPPPNPRDAGPTPVRDAGPRDAGPDRDGGPRDGGVERDGGPDRDAGPRDAGPRDGGLPAPPSAVITFEGSSPVAAPGVALRLTSNGAYAELSNTAAFAPADSLCATLTADASACPAFGFVRTATRTADPCDDTPGSTQPCSYDVDWELNVGLADDCGFGPNSSDPRRDDCARPVFARFVDAFGQVSSTVQLDLVLDTRPPVVGASVLYLPDIGVVFPTRTAATVGSTVTVTLVADEATPTLPATLDATLGADALSLARVPGSETSSGADYAANITAAFTGADGTYSISAMLSDAAGNAGTVTASIAIFTTTPQLVVDQDEVSYVRAPHVDIAPEDLGSFTIPGGPARYALAPLDEFEDVAALPPNTFALATGPAAAIRVFADGAPVSDWILPSPDGSWARADLMLAPNDAAYVHVIAVGPAEIPSAPVRIENAWYVASSADAAASPHVLTIGDGLDAAPGEPVETASVAASDGAVLINDPDAAWRRLSERHNPPGHDFTRMAYDSNRERVVLTGEGDAASIWEFDGTVWSDATRKGPVPFPRQVTALAYDAARGETVMFGGGPGPFYSDTWVWDGVRWRDATPAVRPPPREVHGMAYDANTQRVVTHGGNTGLGACIG